MSHTLEQPDARDRDRPVAVIDIGSNSVRLVVYEAATRSPAPLFNEKVLCGLGRTLATTGRLSDDSIERALRALRRFRALATQLGAETIKVVATAAARDAANGPDFIARAEEACGVPIDVLTGRREAQLSAAGVMAGLHEVDGLAADLGGGSLEIVDVVDGTVRDNATLPLGTLRLLDETGGDMARARSLIDARLDTVPWVARGAARGFYAVGGTWRAVARLHMVQNRYPLSVMHGYRMATHDALAFARLLDRLSPTSLAGIRAVAKARRETLPIGGLILERLLARMRPRDLTVSAFGLREGLMHTLLPEAEQARDPLIAACEQLARLRSRSLDHARELTAWTEPLFRAFPEAETAPERRLRHAACLVSDIGWRAHPEYRGEMSLYRLAHAGFAGIDHPGRAFLALAVFYRHQDSPEGGPVPDLRQLVDGRALTRARVLGSAIRVAHMLSASMPGIISQAPIACEGARVVLRIPEHLTALEGERVDRRLAALAKLLDREPEVRIGQDRRRMAG